MTGRSWGPMCKTLTTWPGRQATPVCSRRRMHAHQSSHAHCHSNRARPPGFHFTAGPLCGCLVISTHVHPAGGRVAAHRACCACKPPARRPAAPGCSATRMRMHAADRSAAPSPSCSCTTTGRRQVRLAAGVGARACRRPAPPMRLPLQQHPPRPPPQHPHHQPPSAPPPLLPLDLGN